MLATLGTGCGPYSGSDADHVLAAREGRDQRKELRGVARRTREEKQGLVAGPHAKVVEADSIRDVVDVAFRYAERISGAGKRNRHASAAARTDSIRRTRRASRRATSGATYSAPTMKRMRGPKLFSAGGPTR